VGRGITEQKSASVNIGNMTVTCICDTEVVIYGPPRPPLARLDALMAPKTANARTTTEYLITQNILVQVLNTKTVKDFYSISYKTI